MNSQLRGRFHFSFGKFFLLPFPPRSKFVLLAFPKRLFLVFAQTTPILTSFIMTTFEEREPSSTSGTGRVQLHSEKSGNDQLESSLTTPKRRSPQ